MIYLLISILSSVTVGVLLKFYRRYYIDVNQTIAWNYLTAIALSAYFFAPVLEFEKEQPFPLFIALGILLPLVFWFLTKSLHSQGLARTDIAQRLSLLIPLTAAWFIFGESISTFKLIGLAIGIIGVVLVLLKGKTSTQSDNYLFPALVFVGYGVIDVLFKQVARINAIPYTTALYLIFLLAALISVVFLAIQFLRKKAKFQIRAILPGLVLGLFNFANILSYLRAHKHFAYNPSTVFAAMNLGVIVLGSFIGIFLFKEKFEKINYLGIFLALIAVLVIAISQKHAI